MPRVRKIRNKTKPTSAKLKRGRKPIFTAAQMRVLERMLNKTLEHKFRNLARAL